MDAMRSHTQNISDLPSSLAANDAGKPVVPPGRKRRMRRRVSRTNVRKVEICCLGYSSVRYTLSAATTIIRAQSGPAELLYLLIAAGPDGIDKDHSEVAIWPRTQSALADSTLDMTLLRLRRILGTQRALRVEAGVMRLDIDDDYVSVDVWNFMREADALHARLQLPVDELDPGEISIRCECLLDLYHGPFLLVSSATPWIAQVRDQLQAKFFRVVKQVAAYW